MQKTNKIHVTRKRRGEQTESTSLTHVAARSAGTQCGGTVVVPAGLDVGLGAWGDAVFAALGEAGWAGWLLADMPLGR